MAGSPLIKEFLFALVSCGELTELNLKRIENNPALKEFFQEPIDIEINADDSDDSDEEDEVFERRTTFPENQADVNFFIIRYIEKEWPEIELYPRPAGWVFLKKGSRYTEHPITLHGSERAGSTYSGTVTGTYSGGNNYKISLRGKKFKELDALLCIV